MQTRTEAERTPCVLEYIWRPDSDVYTWHSDFRAFAGHAGTMAPDNAARFRDLVNPQDIPARLAALHALLEGREQAMSVRYRLKRGDGSHMQVQEDAVMETVDGSIAAVKGWLTALPSESSAESANVVGIPGDSFMPHQGRVRVSRMLEEWNATAGRERNGYLLVAGIDNIELYNEAYGAHFTDGIIHAAGERLSRFAARAGHALRIDGDVFALFMPDRSEDEMAATARAIIMDFYDRPIETANGPVTVSVCLGGRRIPAGCGANPSGLLTDAELALSKARRQARGCFVPYRESHVETGGVKALLRSGNDFLDAMRANRLRMAFQPVMDMKVQDVSFHESLIRMADESGKIHSAAHFLPAVEKLGLSAIVDMYSLRTVVRELGEYSRLSLSVNVSNQTIADPEWLRMAVRLLRDSPSVASRLIVEITESCAISDLACTVRFVKTLHDLGCRVALDDFGAGYTAFLQLKDLDVDFVKIDKAFIRNISHDHSKLFIRTLQTLASGINIKTVGEGAETLSEARILADDGVHYVQGYVFGFPQMERTWLPKEHADRKIPAGTAPMPVSDFTGALQAGI